jgi:NAD(P)-dependent dehydrogenase (short-subunit alcohol dehydrogenase family)
MVERAGGRALAIPGDVSAPEAVAHVVTSAESQLGMVDILVNNAGAVGPLGYDWEVDLEDWWRTFEINMRGPFLYARAVLPGMVKRQRGRIVNISTGAGFGRLPQMDAYCATKAALTQWTKCLAADIQAHGVTVFAFHPGMVRTSMVAYLTSPNAPKAVQALFHSLLSQGRDVPIERSAQMLLFLVSGKADALSGRFIRTQDNEEELVRRAEEIRRDDLHVVTLRT